MRFKFNVFCVRYGFFLLISSEIFMTRDRIKRTRLDAILKM